MIYYMTGYFLRSVLIKHYILLLKSYFVLWSEIQDTYWMSVVIMEKTHEYAPNISTVSFRKHHVSATAVVAVTMGQSVIGITGLRKAANQHYTWRRFNGR